MKLIMYENEYWIKNVKLPSNFDSMNDYEKFNYIYYNNLLHKEDGPAVITYSGTKYWFLNGLKHRIEGPAIIWSYGSENWYLNDIKVDGKIYKKIENSSKEELLIYMVDSKYKDYLPLIEYRLSL